LGLVLRLLAGEGHVRACAEQLATDPMTVSRHLRDPLAENVVDCRQEGKNMVFFLKETEERESYAYMAEHYRLLERKGRFRPGRKTRIRDGGEPGERHNFRMVAAAPASVARIGMPMYPDGI